MWWLLLDRLICLLMVLWLLVVRLSDGVMLLLMWLWWVNI